MGCSKRAVLCALTLAVGTVIFVNTKRSTLLQPIFTAAHFNAALFTAVFGKVLPHNGRAGLEMRPGDRFTQTWPQFETPVVQY